MAVKATIEEFLKDYCEDGDILEVVHEMNTISVLNHRTKDLYQSTIDTLPSPYNETEH